jgi:hypothetical protein
MGTTAFLKKTTRAVRSEWQEQQSWLAAWIARLKAGVAEIAATKSSQQFGREEEKE